MKMTTPLLASLFAAAFAWSLPAAAADIQKCLDWEGTVVYQDTPCAKGTGIGAVPRDTSRPNPDALRQAEEDRRLLAQILLAKAARSPAVQVIVPGGPGGAEPYASAGVEPSYAAGDASYVYGAPVYGGGSMRGHRREVPERKLARSPIARSPAILDSPAPCNTALCGRAGVGGDATGHRGR